MNRSPGTRTPNVKAILVDLCGVLLQMDWQPAAEAWEQALGHPSGTFLSAMFGGNDGTALVGKVPEEEWWDTVRGRLEVSADVLREIRTDLLRRQAADVVLAAGVAALRPSKRVCLVSNAWSGTRTMIEAYGLHGILDEVVISAEVGVAKPNARIFPIAAERVGCAPEECIFIDDVLANVVAAGELGMAGILHSHTPTTLAAVERILAGDRASASPVSVPLPDAG